jgi:hypothetical protein
MLAPDSGEQYLPLVQIATKSIKSAHLVRSLANLVLNLAYAPSLDQPTRSVSVEIIRHQKLLIAEAQNWIPSSI